MSEIVIPYVFVLYRENNIVAQLEQKDGRMTASKYLDHCYA